jgi:cytosine/adenosine deaminase-related metal-dependent hydrolase
MEARKRYRSRHVKYGEGMRMARMTVNRRRLLSGAAALATTALTPRPLIAQSARNAATPAATLPPRRELLIRGATVLTMDPAVPDLAGGDVHIRDGAIVAVAQKIDAPSAEVIDGAGMICIPGFIDTHFHMWTSVFRPFVRADVAALGYFPVTARLGPLMEPEHSYRAVRLGAIDALSAGITTVHNWAHNTRSPEHADAELSAMRDLGVRGRFSYGTPVGLADDAPMDFAGAVRVKRDWMPDRDGLLTLGMCSRNLGAVTIGGGAAAASRGVLTIDNIKRDWDGARALGLPITMHTSGASPILALERAGLIGADVQFIHPLLTTQEERSILKARGASYSTAPQLESRRASQLGVIQLGELLEAGVKVSISTDHIASISCDPFSSMRILFALHSHRLPQMPLTLKRLLQLATLDGAVDLGLADRTGSITPGKRADLVLLRASDTNMGPAGDPYEAVVSFGSPQNVDTVLVDGRILRRSGKLTAADEGEIVAQAREAAAVLRDKAKWPG